MKFDVTPSSHTPPYKRIDFTPVRRPIDPADPIDLLAVAMDKLKTDRLWQITKQAAQGTNQPTVPEVDSSGWEAAMTLPVYPATI